jgi:hypothetical protein
MPPRAFARAVLWGGAHPLGSNRRARWSALLPRPRRPSSVGQPPNPAHQPPSVMAAHDPWSGVEGAGDSERFVQPVFARFVVVMAADLKPYALTPSKARVA